MADKDGLSGLPKFDEYRDPRAPEEPDPPPKLYPSLLKWALAGAAVGAMVGGLPEFVSLLSRKVAPAAALGGSLGAALPWGFGGALLGAIVGGLIDDRARRRKD